MKEILYVSMLKLNKKFKKYQNTRSTKLPAMIKIKCSIKYLNTLFTSCVEDIKKALTIFIKVGAKILEILLEKHCFEMNENKNT